MFGFNAYGTIDDLMLEKVQLISQEVTNDESRAIMDIGNVFEEIHRQTLAKLLDTDIMEFGAIPYEIDGKVQPGFRLSPDGVGIVRAEVLAKYVSKEVMQDLIDKLGPADSWIIVFEQKLLAARQMCKTGVYKPYVAQVRCGPCIISDAHASIYSESSIKRCSYSVLSMTNKSYSNTFMKYGNDVKELGYPMRIGVIILYADSTMYDWFLERCSAYLIDDTYIDFGVVPREEFYRLLVYIKSDRIKAVYRYDINTLDPNELNGLGETSEANVICMGICGWKMFDMSMHIVPKDTGYLSGLWPIIDRAARTVRECFKVDAMSAADVDSCYDTVVRSSEMYGEDSVKLVTSSMKNTKLDYSVYGECIDNMPDVGDTGDTGETDENTTDDSKSTPKSTPKCVTVDTIKRIEPRIVDPDKKKVIKYYLVRKCLDALRTPINALLDASFHNKFVSICLASSVRQSVVAHGMINSSL